MSDAAPIAPGEDDRLARLLELVVLDTPSEPLFDSIVQAASQVCGTPIALVSLVDEKRQWFKANVGLPGVAETPREVAFCAHAIMGDDVFEVADATRDPRFADNPLVTGGPKIRSYAGAPLVLPDGHRVGTLCVIDREPRQLSDAQARLLRSLANVASHALQMRGDLIAQALGVRSDYERRLEQSETLHRAILEDQAEFVSLARADGTLVYVNPSYARYYGSAVDVLVGSNLFDRIAAADRDAVRERFERVIRSSETTVTVNRVVTAGGAEQLVEWANRAHVDATGEALVHSVGRDITERVAAEQATRTLATILENTTDYVVQTDRQGMIEYMNPAARLATGVDALEPVTHRSFSEFNTPDTNRTFIEEVLPEVRERDVWSGQAEIYGSEGRVIPVSHLVIAHRDAAGRVARFSAVMRNIADEVEAKNRLEQQTDTLRAVVEAIPALVAVVGADRRYRLVNRSFQRWAGVPRESIVGKTVQEVLGAHEYERSRPWIDRVLAGETVSFEKSYPGATHARHVLISHVPMWASMGKIDGFVAIAQDITDHRENEVRLLDLARRDSLTGLLNRSGFETYVKQVLEDGRGAALGLVVIDLDHFKPVNDLHGHPVGDAVLREFGQRLSRQVRPTDAVARLGGDEFAVALPGVRDAENAAAVAREIIAAAKLPFQVEGLTLSVGASAGVAVGADAGSGLAGLMARADASLYRAKRAGRGRWEGVASD